MKVKVISSFSVVWVPTPPKPGDVLEVDDHRHDVCRQLRQFAEKGFVEVLVPQKNPFGTRKAEVRP